MLFFSLCTTCKLTTNTHLSRKFLWEIMLNFHKKFMDFNFIMCFRVKFEIKIKFIFQIERISRGSLKFYKNFSIIIFFTMVIIVSIKNKTVLMKWSSSCIWMSNPFGYCCCWQEFLSEKKKRLNFFGWLPHYSVW